MHALGARDTVPAFGQREQRAQVTISKPDRIRGPKRL